MTIAISLKVNDGLVLAADSASTLFVEGPAGAQAVVNVYNNANKIFNLRKGLPLGAMTWGSGSIGPASISTLAKDLRKRFHGHEPTHMDWKIDPFNYSVLAVAQQVRKFMYEEQYIPAFEKWTAKPPLGFLVGGYSTGAPLAEEYMILIQNGECGPPRQLRQQQETGMTWNGEQEAISRLVLGYSPGLGGVLKEKLGVPDSDVPRALNVIKEGLVRQLISPAMPIQDAIDLAVFLVELTEQFSRFSPGAPTVGGPVEVAAITKHEKFKWVRRKHYYSPDFNPPVPLEE